MMWKRMLKRLRPTQADDDLKAAATAATDRLRAELERMDIRVELATQRTIEQIEQELRRSTQPR